MGKKRKNPQITLQDRRLQSIFCPKMHCVGQGTPVAEAEDFLLNNKLHELCSVRFVQLESFWYSQGCHRVLSGCVQ